MSVILLIYLLLAGCQQKPEENHIVPPRMAEDLRLKGKASCVSDGEVITYRNMQGHVISAFKVLDGDYFLGTRAHTIFCLPVQSRSVIYAHAPASSPMFSKHGEKTISHKEPRT